MQLLWGCRSVILPTGTSPAPGHVVSARSTPPHPTPPRPPDAASRPRRHQPTPHTSADPPLHTRPPVRLLTLVLSSILLACPAAPLTPPTASTCPPDTPRLTHTLSLTLTLTLSLPLSHSYCLTLSLPYGRAGVCGQRGAQGRAGGAEGVGGQSAAGGAHALLQGGRPGCGCGGRGCRYQPTLNQSKLN